MFVKKNYAVSINISAAALLMACGPLPLFAQPDYFFGAYDSGVYGILDRHFGGVLFPEVYKSLPSVKIAYPGLWGADGTRVGVGVLPDQIANSEGVGWNALYAHADIDLSPGGAGLWLGNANAGNSFRIFESYDRIGTLDVSEFSLRGAFWVSPRRTGRFLGVSAAFDVDGFYADVGNDFGGHYDDKSYYLNVNTLVRLSENYRLRVTFGTRNRYADNPEDTRDDDARHFIDAFSVGLSDDKLRTLEIAARNTFAVNNANRKSDTVAFSLRYTRGGAISYMKHTLFLGLTADVGAAYPSKISQSAGSFHYYHYLRRMTDEGRVASMGVSVPIIADVDLFRGVHCMLSVCPAIRYTNTAPLKNPEDDVYLNPQHGFSTELSNVEVSVRGVLGDKMDFIVMPTVKNDVFFSALEVRYKF